MKRVFTNKKVALFIMSLQEAFTATVPFFVLASTIALFHFIFNLYHLSFRIGTVVVNSYQIWQLQDTFYRFSSFVATATIAYFFAKRVNTSPIISTTLAIATLITYLELADRRSSIVLPYGLAPVTLVNPIVSAYLLKLFSRYLLLPLPAAEGKLHIYRYLKYLLAFLVAYATTVVLFKLTADTLGVRLGSLVRTATQSLPQVLVFAIRDLLSQVLWFIGIHGDRVVNALFGKGLLELEMFPNLSFGEFNRLFVVLGGSGAGLGLLLALLLRAREHSLRLITWISAPFVVFNINTLLIYAVVVLNRYLLLPFVGLPLLNFALGYAFLKLVNVQFSEYYVMWNTPALLDGYLKTGGNWVVPGFQALLIAMNTAVYCRFIGRYLQIQSTETHLHRLEKNLGLLEELQSHEGLNAFVARQRVMEAHARLDEVLRDLNEENLSVYYQPKIPLSPGEEPGLEALLRCSKNGRVVNPEFLEVIEEAGMAFLIDIWVSRRVKEDLGRLRAGGFRGDVSINLHPDTFLSNDAITRITSTLEGERVVFEIVERSFFAGETALKNLRRLKERGFDISIDDFGSGYSSLETIIRYQFYELKLDRSLTETVTDERGYLVCKNIVDICHQVDSKIVAEGVETKEQLERLCSMGSDFVQGFYLAPAMPLEEALEYVGKNSRVDCRASAAAAD